LSRHQISQDLHMSTYICKIKYWFYESTYQGCQMVCFQTKNPNLGKFWNAWHWKILIYFMSISNILHTFGIFHGNLVHFVFIWYILSGFGIMYQEKSGNPATYRYAEPRSDFFSPEMQKQVFLLSLLGLNLSRGPSSSSFLSLFGNPKNYNQSVPVTFPCTDQKKFSIFSIDWLCPKRRRFLETRVTRLGGFPTIG
jgi:hypothetical protein